MELVSAYPRTLFGQGPASIRADAPVLRHQLDPRCWLDVSRDWLAGADDLFGVLLTSLDWRQGRRPMYGELVEDPRLSATIDPGQPDTAPVIAAMIAWLDHQYDESIDSVWVNYYRDGRDSVAWHSDRVGRTRVNPLVAIVSLGGPRRFLLRPLGGGPAVRLMLATGDLLVMGGACQHAWEHSVPKSRRAPPRMSITFRRHPSGGTRAR